MPPRRYPSCEQKQKLLVNVLYRPDIMIFVSMNIRPAPSLLQTITLPLRTISVRLEVIAAVLMEFESSGMLRHIDR